MKKKLLTIAFAVFVFSIPVLCIVNGQPLTAVLKDLRSELKLVYEQSEEEQELFEQEYEKQHKQMMNVLTSSNELSILLYTQEQEMTFDLAYALNKVSRAYKDFSKERKPYDRIVRGLNVEIDRYARLIEALRRLPPVMEEIELEILPDSLWFRNDSLDRQLNDITSSLEREVIRIAVMDSVPSPFILDEEGQVHRDTCIRYASDLLKRHMANRDSVITDSTHYQAAYLRMKEAYDYAQSRYKDLETYVFVDGQTPFLEILADPRGQWKKVEVALHAQYDFSELTGSPADSAALAGIDFEEDNPDTEETQLEEEDKDLFYGLSSKGANSVLALLSGLQIVALVLFWLLAFFVLWLLSRIPKVKGILPMNRLPLFSVLVGTIVYFLILGFGVRGNEYVQMSARHINTFLWLLIAISGSLLLRVKQEQVQHCARLYIPTIIIALIIIVCRISFVPDRLMNYLFPPILAFAVFRQLFFSIKESGKATSIDSTLGWASLAIYLITFVSSFLGYTFVALLILVWWYFQLAVLLTIVCIADLMERYKERWLDKRVDALREQITYVSGPDRETLLFGATWFYDFIRNVAIPAMFLLSLPLCIRMSLRIFDFDDLFIKIYHNPFVQMFDKEGFETLRISARSIIGLLLLFLVLKYFNRAIHAIWQFIRYAVFMRKHNRTTIRPNEVNLSLGNSIISVLVWMTYALIVVSVWRIPTGSLTLIAGGLSAGIGLALKDTINNFIYGIQLMGGRLRVGDWIECDGVRGRVAAINYQCVVVETHSGSEMSFLNSALFGKNFNNLTRNNSYEFVKIIVGVAYGTDIKKVREVLLEALEKGRTKDKYGRDIVDPGYGIRVSVADMADSSVNIAVKQRVLVPERGGYIDRTKETIYETLNENGISIPFPQCDVHLIQDEK